MNYYSKNSKKTNGDLTKKKENFKNFKDHVLNRKRIKKIFIISILGQI